jgi:hypothetical protein
LVDVITYRLAAYAPPVIANTSATTAIPVVALKCLRLNALIMVRLSLVRL